MSEKTTEDWAAELRDWPIEAGLYVCEPGAAMPNGAPYRWTHHAVSMEQQRSGATLCRCLACGTKWTLWDEKSADGGMDCGC